MRAAKHLGQPSEIASVIAFLCSHGASFMTGEVLHHRGVSNPSACSGDRQGQLRVSHQRRLVGRAVIPARLLELRTTDLAIGTNERQRVTFG